MKILILKPSSLGDVVQALPVLRMLKLQFPSSQIHWWISADLKSILEGDPDLDGLFPFHRQAWARPRHWRELLRSTLRMRELKFDWVIDLQGLARSGAVAWLAGGGLTLGLDDAREGARGFYDIAVRRPSYDTHAVDWYLEVIRHWQVPVRWDFAWLPERKAVAAALQEKWNPAPGRWIILNPGARWSNKRWPVPLYRELAQRILRGLPQTRLAVLGGASETDLAREILSGLDGSCLNLAGQTTLPEMIEWIRFCDLMITNDTGPMHIAAALGKPIVPIFGPTEPRRTGPYGQVDQVLRVDLPCSPCLKSVCRNASPLECLYSIPPAEVFERVKARLRSLR